MKAEQGGVLIELEAVLASTLFEFPATPCAMNACPRAAQAAADVAKRITDTLSYEWGGQQIYFKIGAATNADSPMSQAVEEFLTELEEFSRRELRYGECLSCCHDCPCAHGSWDDAVTEMMSDVYAALQGRQIYIPVDPDRRNMLILRDFTGNNIMKLARKYKLSSSSIYHILGKCRRKMKPEGLREAYAS